MAKTGFGCVVAIPPPWTKGAKAARGYIFKKYHFPSATAQKKQQLKLAQAAFALYGQNLSRVAFLAAITPRLSGSVGGQTKEWWRNYRHTKAQGTISRLSREVGGAPIAFTPGV